MLRALLMLALHSPPALKPDSMQTLRSAGTPVRVIRVNLSDPRVRVATEVARNFPGGDESFASMIARARPTIAINGAYFSKETKKPIGDIVMEGKKINEGLMGTAFAVNEANDAVIRRVTRGHSTDWSGYSTVLACGPALVLKGEIDVKPAEEGFHDPHVMGSTRRMGIGLTRDRRLLIVTTLAPVTFERWAQVMKGLGCESAMNLDAGASLAMYYRGETILRPGRHLTNLLLIYVKND
jgi:exopolysaccharide biosynthesis protein